jgi:hypothetical protein
LNLDEHTALVLIGALLTVIGTVGMLTGHDGILASAIVSGLGAIAVYIAKNSDGGGASPPSEKET